MARLDVTRDEVLAWMAASGSGPTEAARHFGIPSGTIKIWQFRMRREAGHETAKPKPRNHATSPAVLQLLPPAPPRLSMSAKVAAHIRAGIDARSLIQARREVGCQRRVRGAAGKLVCVVIRGRPGAGSRCPIDRDRAEPEGRHDARDHARVEILQAADGGHRELLEPPAHGGEIDTDLLSNLLLGNSILEAINF